MVESCRRHGNYVIQLLIDDRSQVDKFSSPGLPQAIAIASYTGFIEHFQKAPP